MNYIYGINTSLVCDEEGAWHRVYGIDCREVDSGALVRHVEGIFCCRADALDLAELCTRLELSPDHLCDVICDALSGI